MTTKTKFRIAIIGSGLIGKLLLSSAKPHPRISYVQYEAETLPLHPSFGYGREVLLELFDSFGPDGFEIGYGKRLKTIEKADGVELKLGFEDGNESFADAVWACDGMNSLCRQLIQGSEYQPATYSGHVAFRGKVDSRKVESAVGKQFAEETYMFIGMKGWHILIFPIKGGKFMKIAAFAVEELLNDQPGRCTCLELTSMETLETFYNEDLCMTSFGDAANGMLPHIAGSMSTGFIGVTTFLHEEFNPLIQDLSQDATNDEIREVLIEAIAGYEAKHKPLAQKLIDYSREQGAVFSGGILQVEELQRRPRLLWDAASHDCVV